MSAAILCGRRWYFDASDTFIPHLCSTLFSVPLLIGITVFYCLKRDDLPCGTELDLLFIVSGALLLISIIADIAIMWAAYDVRIFRQSKMVIVCLYFKLLLFWIDLVSHEGVCEPVFVYACVHVCVCSENMWATASVLLE